MSFFTTLANSRVLGLGAGISLLSVWGQLIFFSIFTFYALFGMLSKGMVKSFLLSEDESLTPNIDGVMAL